MRRIEKECREIWKYVQSVATEFPPGGIYHLAVNFYWVDGKLRFDNLCVYDRPRSPWKARKK